MARITPELLQQELEVVGRLEVAVKAEIGELRDALRTLSKQLEESRKREDRLMDRILEMTLIQQGAFKEALSLRRSPVLDPASADTVTVDDWGQPVKKDEKWPPDGFVEMQVP